MNTNTYQCVYIFTTNRLSLIENGVQDRCERVEFNAAADTEWLPVFKRILADYNVTGVTDGFKKELEINGVGYRASMQGAVLKLALGYSHDVLFEVPTGITVTAPKPTEIIVEGIDQQQVGEVAAKIREWRKPEPYKGKGIKYKDEYIFRKEGKSK